MSDVKAAEPNIEDILASIRKIISDDEPAAETAEPTPTPTPSGPPVSFDLPEPEMGHSDEDEDILELTEIVEEPATLAMEREEVMDAEPEPVHKPTPAAEDHASEHEQALDEAADEEPLASPETVHAASDAFARYAHPAARKEPHSFSEHMSVVDGKSVEDLVRELLRPLLREWIDGNLPEIVETLVQKELRKINRRSDDL